MAAFNANDDMLLPDVLGEALVAGAISNLMRDDEWIPQAQVYRAYFDNAVQMIRSGLETVTGKATPGPTLMAPAA